MQYVYYSRLGKTKGDSKKNDWSKEYIRSIAYCSYY